MELHYAHYQECMSCLKGRRVAHMLLPLHIHVVVQSKYKYDTVRYMLFFSTLNNYYPQEYTCRSLKHTHDMYM